MINIEIWSDFACPFCYAGETMLDRAIKKLGIEDKVNVKYKAFELDHKKGNYASNPIDEVFINKFGMSRTDAERQVSHEEQFVRNLNLADQEVLLQAGRDAGIKEEDIKDVLQSNRYVEAVEEDERRAESYGVRGVPYFVIDNKMAVPGAISTDEFKELLQQIKTDKEEPLQEVHAYRCTEDSCELI